MSPEAQRIAIAEACGWTVNPDPKDHSGYRYYAPKGTSPSLGRHALPDYLHNLNAMHEAENTLTEKQRCRYSDELYSVAINHAAETGKWRYLSMTSAQRAEAFLRTIGKWQDAARAKEGKL